MRKKILVKGPVLSRSGYGEQSRFALRALRSREELFDVYLINLGWGQTGQSTEMTEEIKFIKETLLKTQVHIQQGGTFDISLQITVPNEFEKVAPINIGYTAGIETTKVAPEWIQKANETMNKVIVVSNHSKKVFEQTKYDVKDGNGNDIKGWGLQVPVDVVNYPVRPFEPQELDFNLTTNTNFLAVSQWGPRKNLENTIRWFVETFKDNGDVGLILKTNTASESLIDREITSRRLEILLQPYQDRQCKIYLLHGEVPASGLTWLYTHPTMKALINIGHGEGFGLPLFEAAHNGLPLITTAWSGQLDFICKPNKKNKLIPRIIKVDYDVKPVQKEAVWPGIIQEDSMWAFAREKSFKRALNDCLDKEAHYRNEAAALQSHILNTFTQEKMYKQFVDSVIGKVSLEPEEIGGLSFCIPTNGLRPEKTKLTLQSILNQNNNKVPYEIIICGDVSNYRRATDERIVFVEATEDAHQGKVAALRNRAAANSKYDVMVWCDDDIVLDPDWLTNLVDYSTNQGWNVLGNVLLNPDGSRHWDRATLNPHKLAGYDESEGNPNLYQTSGFFLVRRHVWEKVKWNEEKLVHADRNNQVPEDIQFSWDLKKHGYVIHFNKNSTVWHNDNRYTEFNNMTILRDVINKQLGFEIPFTENESFIKLKELLLQ